MTDSRTMAALPVGARLGPYEVVAPLGAGGMGDVYRARDTRLGRTVAIKLLNAELSGDAVSRERFEGEARSIAALTHPHICTLHDVGDHEGAAFLVMELLEGHTLAARLARTKGGLPIDEALSIATHVAEALAFAHRHHITHRDIKPANIMLTPTGVKLLDFGLARLRDRDEVTGQSRTQTSLAGPHGAMGTLAYMSPEQLDGRADQRSDIFAFGAVLFEMLTGRKAFDGSTASTVIGAIVHTDPSAVSSLRPEVSPSLERVARRCLAKDPDARWQSTADLVDELRWITGHPMLGGDTIESRARQARVLPVLVATLSVALVAAAWTIYSGDASRPEARWQRFTQLTDLAGEEGAPVISPDGASIAYTSRARGSWDIYMQRVGGHNPTLVAGDSERQESAPAFSPDSQRLAFHEEGADGGIFIVGATGESSRRLTDAGFHPAWSPDGRSIVYCTEDITSPYGRYRVSALWIVDAAGGRPRRIDDGDAVQPAWSPSGARIAFWAMTGGQRDLFTIPAAGGARVAVLEDAALDWSPVWAPDGRSLYFASDRGGATNVWRIAVDESTGRALGAPEPVTGGVHAAADLPSLSKDGTKLVFRSLLTAANPVAVPFDARAERLGAPTPLFERTGLLSPWDVSPDGQWLALTNLGEQREDIFISRTDGSDLRRLTDDMARDRLPAWSPDGRELAFYSNRGGDYQIWTIRRDGSRLTQRSDDKGGGVMNPVWSPTDDRMVGSKPGDMIGFLWDLSIGWSSSRALPGLITPQGWLRAVDWSADGRRLAGVVQDAGANKMGIGWYDVNAGTSTVVSHDRSSTVHWLPDSRRMLIVTDKSELVIVDADTKRRKVLPTGWPFQIDDEAVALAPDGRTLYVGARKVESDIWMTER